MALKTWQYTLVFILQALAIAFDLYFLAPDHTELGGKRRGGWNHRTAVLSLGIVMNVVVVIMVWAIPKRNVFFGCLVSSSLTVVLSSDTIWKCSFVLVGGKLVAFVMVVVFLAGARKLAARLSTGGASGASLLTQTQKTCSCGVVLNSVGLLATPDSSILAVVEILLWIGVLAESWVHFVAFEHTVNDTFGQVANVRVQSAPSVASPQQPVNAQPLRRLTDSIKHAKSTRRNVSRNVRGIIVACHLLTVAVFLASPLWSANVPSPGGQCQVCALFKSLNPALPLNHVLDLTFTRPCLEPFSSAGPVW
jgi:hypothetical protein